MLAFDVEGFWLTLCNRHLVIDLDDEEFLKKTSPLKHSRLLVRAFKGPKIWQSVFFSIGRLLADDLEGQKRVIADRCSIRTRSLQIAASQISHDIVRVCDPGVLKNVVILGF